MKLPLVKDMMTTKLVTLRPEMDLLDAIHKLMKHDVSGAPVVSPEGELEGMLSEKDCMRLFAASAFNDVPRSIVAEYMVTHPETLDPNTDLFTVAGMLMHRPYRRLPVVENGKLVGLISRADVLKACVAFYEHPEGKAWTDAKYLTDEIKAALDKK